jgi:hypothetical protein
MALSSWLLVALVSMAGLNGPGRAGTWEGMAFHQELDRSPDDPRPFVFREAAEGNLDDEGEDDALPCGRVSAIMDCRPGAPLGAFSVSPPHSPARIRRQPLRGPPSH